MATQDTVDESAGHGWSLWASQQMEISRLSRRSWLVGGAGVVVAAGMAIYIGHQNSRIDYLATNRQMYCEAAGDGLYRSTQVRPTEMLDRFVRRFVANTKQFDRDTVEANFAAARRMMAPEVAASAEPMMDAEATKVRAQGISQWFTPKDIQIRETASGYSVRVVGVIGGFAGSAVIKPSKDTVTLELRKVPATEARPEGVMVVASGK